MLKKTTVILALTTLFAYSAVNYPYPQAKPNANGINVTTANASTNLLDKFKIFISTNGQYREGTCSSPSNGVSNNTPCARIEFQDAGITVSEGIGYAMLMAVYFSGTTSYQSQFDKLWTYYKTFRNSNGVMSWKINGFTSVVSGDDKNINSASDAEFDVALALVMAYYQFGDQKYKDDAENLIIKIRAKEFNGSPSYLHKPGDTWDDYKNPSYVAPAAFHIFKDIDDCEFWVNAINKNYALLKANANSSTGLPSDWSNASGTPVAGLSSTDFSYDAARAPWRWATANAWFGHADAKTLLTKLATWVNGKAPGDVGGKISLSGGMGGDKNSTFIGSLMTALTVSSTYQNNLNSYWTTLIGRNESAYFERSLQLLTGLLVTGNMPNLAPSTALNCTINATDTSGVKIDQLTAEKEDDKRFAKTWEEWYAFTDAGDKGASTITNAKSTVFDWNKEHGKCENMDAYKVILKDGNDWVAKIDRYTLNQGDNAYEPYVALGLDAQNNGTAYDFSNCKGGFRYSYKGKAHNFKVQMSTVTNYGYHQKEMGTDSDNAWKTVTVKTAELEQPPWATTGDNAGKGVAFNLSKVNAFVWELKGGKGTETGLSAKTGSLAIKDFKCIGTMQFPKDKPASKCGGSSSSNATGGNNSSSSRANSSSSGGSSSSALGNVSSSSVLGSGSSSSTDGEGDSSSSEGDDTPIVLPQIVHSNALNSVNNGVNLQAMNNATIQIFDLKGKTVRTLKFKPGNYIVQLADLPRGLYIAKATSESWKQTVKVMVK
ncbi:MAG: T9SS type A sorting domain-containing protein [Fibromonadaceae bacterium]|jgi:endo-1,4-beta-D-glucanase Y|nr:T9SS type A sorting domain-containing protein [Fibromonadaceae bacterium]